MEMVASAAVLARAAAILGEEAAQVGGIWMVVVKAAEGEDVVGAMVVVAREAVEWEWVRVAAEEAAAAWEAVEKVVVVAAAEALVAAA